MAKELVELMDIANVRMVYLEKIAQLHVKMQPIAVAMKPAEPVAVLGVAVQSKVNVEFTKETVIVMMNVRVL